MKDLINAANSCQSMLCSPVKKQKKQSHHNNEHVITTQDNALIKWAWLDIKISFSLGYNTYRSLFIKNLFTD